MHCHIHASVRKGARSPRQDLSVTPLHPCYGLRRGRVFLRPTRRALRRWRRRACAHGKLSAMQLARSLVLLTFTVVAAQEDVLQHCTKVKDADRIAAALATSPTGSASVCLSGASNKCVSPSRDITAQASGFGTERAFELIAIAAVRPAVVHSAEDLAQFCRMCMWHRPVLARMSTTARYLLLFACGCSLKSMRVGGGHGADHKPRDHADLSASGCGLL